jgi:hypothetical protein
MSVTMNNSPVRASEGSVTVRLMPLLATVLLAFLVIGVALPVLPLHVRSLGFGLPSAILILPKPVSRSPPKTSSIYPSSIRRVLCSAGMRCIKPLAPSRNETN